MNRKMPKWILWVIAALVAMGIGYGLYQAYVASDERESRRQGMHLGGPQ